MAPYNHAIAYSTLDPWLAYLKARLEAHPGMSAQRLMREIGERGYTGGYSTEGDTVRAMRPAGGGSPFAVRFETPPGQQAQVDFAQFRVRFTNAPDSVQIVWLFSMVLGFSRLIWGRFAQRQTMQTVLACHRAAFEAIGGVPREILYDRMKTAVLGEDEDGRGDCQDFRVWRAVEHYAAMALMKRSPKMTGLSGFPCVAGG